MSEFSNLPTLKHLIQFIFGDPVLPRNTNIEIGFWSTSLPYAESCFGIIHLPLLHEDYNLFRASMNTCINNVSMLVMAKANYHPLLTNVDQ